MEFDWGGGRSSFWMHHVVRKRRRRWRSAVAVQDAKHIFPTPPGQHRRCEIFVGHEPIIFKSSSGAKWWPSARTGICRSYGAGEHFGRIDLQRCRAAGAEKIWCGCRASRQTAANFSRWFKLAALCRDAAAKRGGTGSPRESRMFLTTKERSNQGGQFCSLVTWLFNHPCAVPCQDEGAMGQRKVAVGKVLGGSVTGRSACRCRRAIRAGRWWRSGATWWAWSRPN